MKVIGNLKIEDSSLLPYCIFIFAIRSLSGRKSNNEENISNFVILAAIE